MLASGSKQAGQLIAWSALSENEKTSSELAAVHSGFYKQAHYSHCQGAIEKQLIQIRRHVCPFS
ncbi:hypothetical protein, partial [Citrobacter sp.]|uniref:hypothetical protein n=1 Tax=Citrobacter sp. TaxID=1896336 RepID=UPI00291675EE